MLVLGRALGLGSWGASVYTRLTLGGGISPAIYAARRQKNIQKYTMWSKWVGSALSACFFVRGGWLGWTKKTRGLFKRVVSLSFWSTCVSEWQEGIVVFWP